MSNINTDIDYQKDVAIDEAALDREWLGLPSVYAKYNELEAAARYEVGRLIASRDKQHAIYKRIYAELACECRADPGQFGLNKLTESALVEAVMVSPRYQEAIDLYHAYAAQLAEAQHKLDVVSGVKWALEMKKKALDGLTTLWSTNYGVGTGSNDVLSNVRQTQAVATQNAAFNDKMNANRRTRGGVDVE